MAFLLPETIQIVAAVHRAVSKAFQSTTQSEPQLVANLVWQLPHFINQIKFHGTSSVRAGGIFVHAQPFVSFPEITPKSVEIGDLLLVRTLVENNMIVERRALLLQAKKVKRIPAIPDNQNQWHLYELWPCFTYARSGSLNGKKRHIKEPDMYDAAKYLLIGSDQLAYHSPWIYCPYWPFYWHKCRSVVCMHYTAQPTKPKISRYKSFVGELVEFLMGNAGKTFNTPSPGAQGWDQVIHDLIGETAKIKSAYMRRAVGDTAQTTRGSGVLFYSLAEQADHFMVAGSDDGRGDDSNATLPAQTQGGDNDYKGSPEVPIQLEDDGSKGPPEVPPQWGDDADSSGISIIEFVLEQGEG